ncbi:alpha/beta hydrolase [Nesterenkonia populi]|uniref:alpha/beta hydrolase n=1 Tax=Nesterenkonia populi TaxID=1591087 RepID=UPI001FE7CA54|nr:alpha/beta hydrolase [Nesterenkonia populi]
MTLRVYEPLSSRQQSGALLWIHGGGFVMGTPSMNDRLCLEVARRLGVVVFSPEYRLSPKHPYPTPLDDCMQAWTYMQDHARAYGIASDKVAVGGQSAGGGLAAMLALRLAEASGNQPIAQWLFSPMLDDRTAAARELDGIGHFTWGNDSNRFGWTSFLAAEPGSDGVPAEAVPARAASLSSLPPTWMGVGTIDLFHDENRRYATALADAGVRVRLSTVPGAPHGFEEMSPQSTVVRNYIDDALAWLEACLQR